MKIFNIYIVIKIVFIYFVLGFGEMVGSVHVTKSASEKLPDLWCYKCDSVTDGEHCEKVDATYNSSVFFQHKCSSDERICKVNKILVATNTREKFGSPKLWLLQRNCSKTCEEGCIIIGERTKLHSCTTCCEKDFCNVGNQGNSYQFAKIYFTNLLTYLIINFYIL